MSLTELDRISIVYSILQKHHGPKAHRLTGPICWYQDERCSLAQIIAASGDQFDGEIVALCAAILRVQVIDEKPRVWAKKEILELGLLEPDVLAFGAGEGLGLARSVGYVLTDLDVFNLHEAIAPLHKRDATPLEIKAEWLRTIPGMAGYASWHILSFLYSPYLGFDKTIKMIDKEELTKESFDRLYQVDPNADGLTVQKTIDILMGR